MSIRLNGKDKNSTLHTQTGSSPYDISVGTAANFNTKSDAHGTYHLSANSNLYEIQRNNNFELVVAFGGNMAKADGSGESFKGDYAQEVVRMSVSQTSIPHFQQNVIEVKRGNTTVKYAGTPQFSEGSITVNDYIGAQTLDVLMAWQQCAYDVRTEKVGLQSDYKKTATLVEYTPDWQIVRKWTIYGIWINNISESDFSSDDDGKHTVQVSFVYDKAVLDID